MSSHDVYLFTKSNSELFQAKVKVGLTRDYPVSLEEGTRLYKSHKVYVPEMNYYSSDPLPDDWLGMITGLIFNAEESIIKEETKDEEGDLSCSYEMEQTLKEMELKNEKLRKDIVGNMRWKGSQKKFEKQARIKNKLLYMKQNTVT